MVSYTHAVTCAFTAIGIHVNSTSWSTPWGGSAYAEALPNWPVQEASIPFLLTKLTAGVRLVEWFMFFFFSSAVVLGSRKRLKIVSKVLCYLKAFLILSLGPFGWAGGEKQWECGPPSRPAPPGQAGVEGRAEDGCAREVKSWQREDSLDGDPFSQLSLL